MLISINHFSGNIEYLVEMQEIKTKFPWLQVIINDLMLNPRKLYGVQAK